MSGDEGRNLATKRLPFHPAFPRDNAFIGKDVRTAERVTTALENYLLTGVRRAQLFRPTKDDVLLISGPCSGEETLGRIVAGLITSHPEDLASRDDDWTIPWIESRYTEESPSDIAEPIFSDKTRVLRTQMAMTMLNPRQHKGPKYVVLLRHPLDMRAEFYKYLRSCYEMPCKDGSRPRFEDMFSSADAFANIPVTLCQMSTVDPASYEQFVSDWYRESRVNPDILLVFYESLMSNPRREITRIGAFLDGTGSKFDTREATRRRKETSPAFQMPSFQMEDKRLAPLLGIGKLSGGREKSTKKLVANLKRVSMAIKRKVRSTSTRSGSSSSGSRGSFFNDGDGGSGMGGSMYENASSVRQIQHFWEQRVGLSPASYEKLYENDMGEAYPCPQLSLPKDPLPVPSTSPLQVKIEAVTSIMNAARARLTTVKTTVLKSEIAEKVLSPVSALRPSRFRSDNGDGGRNDGDELLQGSDPLPRDYAGSMLPAQAFTGQEWTASATLNPSAEHRMIQEESDEPVIDASEFDARASSPLSDAATSSYSAANKWVSQEVMEANMLRSSMRQAGIDKAKIDVVAVKSEQLSEML